MTISRLVSPLKSQWTYTYTVCCLSAYPMVEAEGAGEVFPPVHTYPDDEFGRVLEAQFVYECESAPAAAKIAIHLLRGVRRLFECVAAHSVSH